MAQDFLHNPDVGAETQQQRRHCVPHHMRRYPCRDSRIRRRLDDYPRYPRYTLSGDSPTARVYQQSVMVQGHFGSVADVQPNRLQRAVVGEKC